MCIFSDSHVCQTQRCYSRKMIELSKKRNVMCVCGGDGGCGWVVGGDSGGKGDRR